MSYFGTVINCTQHDTTIEQKEDRIFDLPEPFKSNVRDYLTFDDLPDQQILNNRAHQIVHELILYISHCEDDQGLQDRPVMIGGAPFFMKTLHTVLESYGAIPKYAFSQRQSVEQIVNGQVIKKSVFVHHGLV